MQVIYSEQVDQAALPTGATANTFLMCVEVGSVREEAARLIEHLTNTSWINSLRPVAIATYRATVFRSVNRLVQIFREGVKTNSVSERFGEFLVSSCASDGLGNEFNHEVFPLAELWKEKILGNHGFDFHTESTAEVICFGEAKYDCHNHAYGNAAEQVLDFIDDEKDLGDAQHLENFATEQAIAKLLEERARSFCIAFFLHSPNHCRILSNTLASGFVQKLACECEELYIVGVRA